MTRYMYASDRPMRLHHRHLPVFDRTWLPGPGTDPNTFHWEPNTVMDRPGWTDTDNKSADMSACHVVGDSSANDDTGAGTCPVADEVELPPRSDDGRGVDTTTATVVSSPSQMNDYDDSDDSEESGDSDDDYYFYGEEMEDDVF